MCLCLRIQPSGFYAWLKNPLSKRATEDTHQTDLIRKAWKECGKVYGYRKLHDDLLDQGEAVVPNRLARLASLAGIKVQIGYKRQPGSYGSKPSLVVDYTLARQFDVDTPDRIWITEITYIRTLEGFAYLAVVIDLYSRRVAGWSMQNRQTTDVVLQVLFMAVWRRKPKSRVLIHWESRRGNCHDNAVAESFPNLLQRKRIRRRNYKTRLEARQGMFKHFEMFYKQKRKPVRNGGLSPNEFERCE
jgi:putative transposase